MQLMVLQLTEKTVTMEKTTVYEHHAHFHWKENELQ